MPKEVTLDEGMLKIMGDLRYVQKDGKNKAQNYTFLSEKKIKTIVGEGCCREGILFNLSTEDIAAPIEMSPTKNGAKQVLIVAKGTFRFWKGKDEICGSWCGSGIDTGDKALFKAITGGYKYIMNTCFMIPTGDDPENDEGSSSPPKKSSPKSKREDEDNPKWTELLLLYKMYRALYAEGLKIQGISTPTKLKECEVLIEYINAFSKTSNKPTAVKCPDTGKLTKVAKCMDCDLYNVEGIICKAHAENR